MECGVSSKKRLRRSGERRFAYRLALQLGHVNVERMLRQISIRQLQEWRAYADLEPFDAVRADMRAGSIVQAIYNVHRGKNKAPIPLKDCVLHFAAPETRAALTPEQSRAQVRQTLDMLMTIHGQNPKRPKRGR